MNVKAGSSKQHKHLSTNFSLERESTNRISWKGYLFQIFFLGKVTFLAIYFRGKFTFLIANDKWCFLLWPGDKPDDDYVDDDFDDDDDVDDDVDDDDADDDDAAAAAADDDDDDVDDDVCRPQSARVNEDQGSGLLLWREDKRAQLHSFPGTKLLQYLWPHLKGCDDDNTQQCSDFDLRNLAPMVQASFERISDLTNSTLTPYC